MLLPSSTSFIRIAIMPRSPCFPWCLELCAGRIHWHSSGGHNEGLRQRRLEGVVCTGLRERTRDVKKSRGRAGSSPCPQPKPSTPATVLCALLPEMCAIFFFPCVHVPDPCVCVCVRVRPSFLLHRVLLHCAFACGGHFGGGGGSVHQTAWVPHPVRDGVSM